MSIFYSSYSSYSTLCLETSNCFSDINTLTLFILNNVCFPILQWTCLISISERAKNKLELFQFSILSLGHMEKFLTTVETRNSSGPRYLLSLPDFAPIHAHTQVGRGKMNKTVFFLKNSLFNIKNWKLYNSAQNSQFVLVLSVGVVVHPFLILPWGLAVADLSSFFISEKQESK